MTTSANGEGDNDPNVEHQHGPKQRADEHGGDCDEASA